MKKILLSGVLLGILSVAAQADFEIGGIEFNKVPVQAKNLSVSNGGTIPDSEALSDGIGMSVMSAAYDTEKPDFKAMNQALLGAEEGEIIKDDKPELFVSSNDISISCKDILDRGMSTGNGIYEININDQNINVYCDMVTDGGGWTLILAQYELDPVKDWNEGIQSDYDPTLESKHGFALSSSQLPIDRSEIGFGKDLDPTYVNYGDFIYTTGNIPVTLIKSNNGTEYQIHRDINTYYGYHDPENSIGDSTRWNNTLTIDKTGLQAYTWAFSPEYDLNTDKIGYALSGSLEASTDNFAWTIWVR